MSRSANDSYFTVKEEIECPVTMSRLGAALRVQKRAPAAPSVSGSCCSVRDAKEDVADLRHVDKINGVPRIEILYPIPKHGGKRLPMQLVKTISHESRSNRHFPATTSTVGANSFKKEPTPSSVTATSISRSANENDLRCRSVKNTSAGPYYAELQYSVSKSKMIGPIDRRAVSSVLAPTVIKIIPDASESSISVQRETTSSATDDSPSASEAASHAPSGRRSAMPMQRFCCNRCDKSYLFKKELLRHINSHTRQKTFRCPCCGKCYLSKAFFKKHIRAHIKVVDEDD